MARSKSKARRPKGQITVKSSDVTMSITGVARPRDLFEAISNLRRWRRGLPIETSLKPLWKPGVVSEQTVDDLPVLVVHLKKLDPKVKYLAFYLDPL